MAVRLSKIAREFNVGLSTIVEFLHSKGIKISSDPNAKLTDEDYALVAKEFSSDSQVKKESSLVDLKNTRKKKETVTIDNAGNISSGNENTEEEEEEFISIKDEVRFENKIKIVDHIDLNPEKKTQPEPVEAKVEQPKRETQEEITEKVEEPKVTRVEVEETQEEEREVTPEVEPEISVQMEESSESTPFKVAQPALKDVKVVGTIDLDAINQRTRPPKKSKQERERDRREQKKANKPFVSAAKTEQPVASPSTDIVNKGEEDADIRKKRKRIHRQDEKIQVEAATVPAKNAKIEENKRKLKKLKKKVGDGVIKSTVEGVVKEATDEASAKNENKPVVSVVGEEGFYVTGRVGETMLDQIKEGMTATVMSWQSGESYEATVTGVGNSPVSDYSTGENQNQSFYPFTLVIHGDANLSNGESVNLSMDGIAAGSDGSIYLEKMFVREEGNRYYVYKRGDNGRLTKQYVEVGKNMYNSLEITSGLTMDDMIAFPYGRDVKEGAKTQEADTLYDYY